MRLRLLFVCLVMAGFARLVAAADSELDPLLSAELQAKPVPELPETERAVVSPDAESARRERNRLIEEIVVTAQKREQNLQEVGISVSAFSGEMLTELGIQDTSSLSDMVPGFTFADSGYSVPIYTIRGVGFNDISQAGSSTVGVYVDEVILPYPAMTKGANLDLQRAEVLKGPQGTLYGRNTTGGAVNYIANRPTDNFEAGLSASYSSFDRRDIEGYISGPLTDTLRGRVAMRGIRADAWQYDYTRPGVEFGADDRLAGRILLDWAAADSLDLTLALDGWNDQSDGQSPQAYVFLDQSAIAGFTPSQRFQEHPLAPEDDARATALDPDKEFFIDESYRGISLRGDWHLADDRTLTFIAAKQKLEGFNHLNLDGMNVEEFEYFIETDVPAKTLEIRFAGDSWDGAVNWVAGYFYSDDTVHEVRDFFLRDNSTGNGGRSGLFDNIGLEGVQESEVNAVFGQLEWQATDAFKYTLGLRYTDERRDNFNCTRDVNGDTALVFAVLEVAKKLGIDGLIGAGLTNEQGDAILDALFPMGLPDAPPAVNTVIDTLTQLGSQFSPAIGGVEQGGCFTLNDETGESGPTIAELNEDNISGRAAIDWTPVDDFRIYGSYSVGFKSGSFPLVPSSNSQQAEPVTQERVDAYEVGLKSTWMDGSLKFNSAIFHYDYEDKQLFAFYRDQIFGTLQRLDNVPRSEIQGIEFEIQYSPVPALFTALNASLLRSEVLEYTGINANGEDVDFSGNEINYTPPLEIAALANYEMPELLFGLDAIVGIDVSYSAETEGELSNDPRFVREAYTLWGARASLRKPDRSWGLTLWGRNLTDEVYYSSLQRLSDIGVRFAGRPRTYGVTLDMEF